MALLKSLATPVVGILILLTVGLVLAWIKRGKRLSRVGWWIVLVGTVLLLVLSLSPVAYLLAYSLECGYTLPSEEVLKSLDMVVVLGGGQRPAGGLRPESELSGVSYARACQGVRLYRRSDVRLLAFCGGRPWPGAASEAELMKAVATDMGVAEDRILTETESRTTQENAARLAELLPGSSRRIGLVTSATHMRRSEGIFAKRFPADAIIPVPVHYLCGPVHPELDTFIPSVRNLQDSTAAIHEWIGLLWYAIRYG
ncbi:MAG: YdcF family protein [Phycisphaerales bacterium]|nr:MAG: YdcF family protein [Phycisphaerales bacterium]